MDVLPGKKKHRILIRSSKLEVAQGGEKKQRLQWKKRFIRALKSAAN
jgi:hypothetical protein